MSDFDIAKWVDFVRGMTPPDEREKMQRHLDEDCRECVSQVRLLMKVVAAASQPPVPDELVQAALSVFPAPAPTAERPTWFDLPRLVARLVYSSLQDPQPEGARSAFPSHIHVMYEVGDRMLDLHIEREADSPEVVLVGQIADRMKPDEPLAPLPIYVGTPVKTVAEAVTNEFGEFSLVYRPREKLRLLIPMATEGKTLELSLSDLLTEQL